MTHPTTGNFGAWEVTCIRWRELTEMIAKPSEESIPLSPAPRKVLYGLFPYSPKMHSPVSVPDISESQSLEWHYYTGFLVALGGCCVEILGKL